MPYRDKTRKDKFRGQVIRSGHKRTQLFDTKSKAREWEVKQKELPLQEFLNGTPTVFSLIEWAESYLEHTKIKHTKSNYAEKRIAFRDLFKSVSPTLEPENLHPGLILKHFGRVAEERSGASANKDRKNLIAGWNWARRYIKGWVKENPFAETDRQSAIKYPHYVPPVADFWKVYDGVEGQDKVMLLTYLHTAARKRELFRLKWHEVDFEKSRIQLWTRKRKDGNLESDWIPMTSELREALERWEKERTFPDAEHVFLCENDLDFCPQHYGNPFSIRREWLSRLCKKVGVKPFGLHAIRHLSASILDDAGYPITIIQGILRHKSANTTARYLHSLRGMRVALDDAFKRKDRPIAREAPGRPSLRVISVGRAPQKAPQETPQMNQTV